MSRISPIMTDSEIMVELGRRLRDLRRSARLKIQEVAQQTGLSRRTIYRTEIGDNPTLATTLRLLRLYGRLGDLDGMLAPPEVSPMSLLKSKPRRKSPSTPTPQEDDR